MNNAKRTQPCTAGYNWGDVVELWPRDDEGMIPKVVRVIKVCRLTSQE